jgi:AcrR family transcriptional regulator
LSVPAKPKTDAGRPNQRLRTRKDLLTAAARLMKSGKRPSLEEVAEEALVSRATAYRYFPNIEALLVEAALDVAMPTPEDLLGADASTDPIGRIDRADAQFSIALAANETPLRIMLANALQQSVSATAGSAPLRQNRRTPIIEAALAPARKSFAPKDYDMLVKTLALIVCSTESMIVFKDVLGVDEAEARRVKRWATRALVEAALK